jgi:hypothetical protein
MSRSSLKIAVGIAALVVGALGCGGSGSGGTAGKGGASGGSGGAGGSTGAGGTAGAAGGTGGSAGTIGTGRGGAGASATGMGGAAGGSDGGTVNCAPGAACTGTETCAASCGGGMRQIACFCDVNSVFACEACLPVDGGAGGTGGLDAGLPACPADPMGMTCSTMGSLCVTSCTNNTADSCRCMSGPEVDGGTALRWRCQSIRCQ